MTPEYFWTKITDFCEKKNMSMTKFCAVNQVSIPVDSWRYCLRNKKFPLEKTIKNVKFFSPMMKFMSCYAVIAILLK
ncbi:hypothetical protein IAE51_10755 [Lactococcus sp. S64]|uniref:hypothetical protein n=1 Tax=Lactococcus sp. S64 TaxID=2767459 RepID=UPI001904A2CB|nr:hypothetical protein [Lactococcus sp. S64]MBK0084373.1 hypothetical protein [Lactococcus sp. S64]